MSSLLSNNFWLGSEIFFSATDSDNQAVFDILQLLPFFFIFRKLFLGSLKTAKNLNFGNKDDPIF